jgi:hypothetical protein
LPIESKEKLILSLSSVVLLIYILLYVSSLLPSTALIIPLFVTYVLFLLSANIVSLVVSVLVLNLSYKSSQMPEVVRNLFLDKLAVSPKLKYINVRIFGNFYRYC